MKKEIRDSPNSYFASLTRSYKNNYWYFEFFVLFRRTVLALFTVTSFTNQNYADIVLILFLSVCVLINKRLNPFIHPRINIGSLNGMFIAQNVSFCVQSKYYVATKEHFCEQRKRV